MNSPDATHFAFDAHERVVIIGMGKTGLACVDVLTERRCSVFITDEMPISSLGSALAHVHEKGARFVPPIELATLLPDITVAVISPGVGPTSPVVAAVTNAGIPIVGEIELAYLLSRAPIIAVSGTKGKSTTTALIGHLLRESGRDVRVGGNIGNPLVAEVSKIGPDGWIVAEVSSFQLESTRTFRPRVSVLLNISEDHLDRYVSMDEYAAAKTRIFMNQGLSDYFVGNLDDERVSALHWHFSGELRMEARQLWFTLRDDARHATMYLHDDAIWYAPITGDPRVVRLVGIDEMPIPGQHSISNVMAAMLSVLAIGVDPMTLRTSLSSYRPPAHRLMPVATVDDVAYIDDSKATNPAAVIAALHAFARPIVLIAGGRSKGTDFRELGGAIRVRAHRVILIGEAADHIAAVCGEVPTDRATSMQEAVAIARRSAKAGDIVLLSPACASFDMFTSAEDRGEQFIAAVRALDGVHVDA
ncbi:MAG: UDP-N-acetylmuramoyl-L-alanine--D-glutamate ligase [Vulcanimicrobiaceae bacterium]